MKYEVSGGCFRLHDLFRFLIHFVFRFTLFRSTLKHYFVYVVLYYIIIHQCPAHLS